MSTPDSYSVVICAYTEERWEALLAAVDSVERQRLAPYEIIVVIDHNERLLARARARFPQHTVIANRETQGLSGARNSGIAVARGSVIVFLDEDAVAAPDWLEWLAAGYEDPQVWGVGGAIEPDWLAGQPGWFPEEFQWVVGCSYRGMPRTAAPVRNLIGCNMSFRRDLFEQVGGFRDGIGRIGSRPLGCEETELCIRAHQQAPQRTFRYEPRARVRHAVPPTRTGWGYFRARCYAEGLSKALVTRWVGGRDGLASERDYTVRTLPRGVARGVGDGLRGDRAGLARALAIVVGLWATTAGYLVGRLTTSLGRA